MGIVVRDSTAEDVSSIQAIYEHHVLHGLASFEEVAPSVAEMRRRRDEVLQRGFPYLVAEIAGTLLGYPVMELRGETPDKQWTLVRTVEGRDRWVPTSHTATI